VFCFFLFLWQSLFPIKYILNIYVFIWNRPPIKILKMKTISLLLLLSFITLFTYAQKTDLDKESIKLSYVSLPFKPVLDKNFRTYAVSVHSTYLSRDAYPNDIVKDKVKLFGFEKINGEGTINVKIDIGNIIISPVKIKKREVIEKNKEGEVISTKYFYKPIINYTTDGSFYVKDHTDKPMTYKLGRTNTHKTEEYNSYSEASSYYNNNKNALRSNFTRAFIKSIPGKVNRQINIDYGYKPYFDTGIFWILDSKKNPDYEAYQSTYKGIKEVLSTLRHDQPIEGMESKLQPAIDYFLSIIPKYPEDKRKHRKMRFASYYNIAQIYYYLDMPNEVLEYANKLIENNYDKHDGESFIKYANTLKRRFKLNNISTRHFTVETLDNSYVENSENSNMQVVESTDVSVKKMYLDAYVVTKAKDTIEGSVETIASIDSNDSNVKIPFINKYVKLYVLNDEDDDVTVKKFYAKDVKKVIINDVAFESVYFTTVGNEQVKGNVVDLDAALKGPATRFCRIIYKSDKIAVYAFKKELILKKPVDKKGVSTSSMGYIVAFKKKLSKFIADCDDLSSQVKKGEFENTEDSLSQLAKEYTEHCN